MGLLTKSKSINRNHSKSGSIGSMEGHLPDVKLTKQDVNNFKVRTATVHDPILSAVQDAQPFEDLGDHANANDNSNVYRKSYLSQINQYEVNQQDPNGDQFETQSHNSSAIKNGKLVDVFGQPINIPDISNPTRERDERPLDTIKSFEYAISGDPSWGSNLETQQYGFRVRPQFSHLLPGNSMNNAEPQYDEQGNFIPPQQQQGYDFAEEQGVYVAPVKQALEQKKKRNFFGKKKKNTSD
ncbi:hypothetical protein QEN19_002464 [Hanseniaspora menglaensis]